MQVPSIVPGIYQALTQVSFHPVYSQTCLLSVSLWEPQREGRSSQRCSGSSWGRHQRALKVLM